MAVTADDDRSAEIRRAAFLRAGFGEAEAAALARRAEIAYLDAVGLLRHGFPPEIVSTMLLAGQRSVF